MSSASTASDYCRRADVAFAPRAHLFVVMSCADLLDAPSRHAIDGVDEVRIGRGAERVAHRADEGQRHVLTVTLSDRRVSSAHAKLSRREDGWLLEDLGSKNGTCVNGKAVSAAALDDRDCIQVGHTLLVFRRALATPRSAPNDLVSTGRAPPLATLVPGFASELDALAVMALERIPMLLVSETGTGKEVLARAVHSLSRRRGEFVAINCGGLPATLVESVLFGHKRGAFSGAVADQLGFFRAADCGTVLLDEIGDMPLAAQAAVLRVLQDGEVQPVGATHPARADVRIVAATHKDLDAMVARGAFREDLLARLAGFTFRLPPLRERREDIGLLVGTVLRRMRRHGDAAPAMSPAAGFMLLRHEWPRNVRELEKCLEHAVALAGDGPLEAEHLPRDVREGVAPVRRTPVDEVRETLVRLLESSGGNVSFTADAMRTSRSQVHRWMKRFGIEVSIYRR
ncbi:MAG TPA: sigma 54-interacting transcriptional regulator [Polyangiaceae bacterium]|nr:sigma 54-interacting transcriptional regulator [Polyangiaceae bacterium]